MQIIGGADGKTAIFVSSHGEIILLILCLAGALLMGVWAWKIRKKKRVR